MDQPSVLRRNCPSQSVLDLIASKWSVLVLYVLRDGPRRPSQLQARIEHISQKMLTQTLRELERDGLVARRVYPVVPPKVEYELTELGRSLEEIVTALGGWAQDRLPEVLAARQAYDTRAPN